MQVVSINVGQPKVVAAGNVTVETAIFKKPVKGPVVVRTLNLEGDRQADLKVHGGVNRALYTYSWKNVEFWREALGRPDLGPGSFGENLTVDDLADDEISVGDQLEIGRRFLRSLSPACPVTSWPPRFAYPTSRRDLTRKTGTASISACCARGVLRLAMPS